MVKDNTTVRDKPTTREEIEELKKRVTLLEGRIDMLTVRDIYVPSLPVTRINGGRQFEIVSED